MRKISKNRTEDDVISSTNGSLFNDEPPEAVKADEPVDEVGEGKESPSLRAEENSGAEEKEVDDDYEVSPKKVKSAKRGRKRKSEKSSKNDKVEEEYEVEKVVDSKKIKGKLHYLIRWKGYSAASDTWEPENTVSCPELITKYHDEKENSKKSASKVPAKTGTKRKAKSTKEAKSPTKKPKTEWDSKTADSNAEYEVERILEVHHKKNGKREFLIHWKGWSNKFDSWEPEKHLNCPELIKKFMEKVDVARNSDTRSLRVAPESTSRFTLQAPTTGRRLSKRRGQRQRVRYDNAE